MDKRFPTYKAFWPYYVAEHRVRLNRNLHFLGTSLVLLSIFMAATDSAWFLLGVPFASYVFSGIGHYFVEKNRPTTFSYPIWTLIADFQMFAFMAAGRMEREVKRMGVLTTE